MTTRSLWTDASSDLQALLRNAGAKLTAGTVKRALRTLNVNGCGAYREQALQEAYAEAGAGLLVCLTPPTDSRDAQSWLNDATKVLVPLFDDDPAGKMLFDTIVFQPGSLTAHLPALHTAWQEHVDGVPLTWKTDVDLPHALQAFVDTFEQAVDASPELRSFLLAARMKQATTNAHPQEVTTLVGIIERLAAQPQERRLFFTDLGRMGYSASGITVHDDTLGSLIVTDDNRTVFISDEGTLAWLFHQLPDHQQVLAEYRAHVYRTSTCVPLDGLGLPLVDGTPLDPDTLHIPLDEIPFPLYALTKDGPAQIPPPDILPTLLKAAIDDHAAPLIQGAPGSGKSALLRRLARAVASGHELLPVRVPLEQVDAAMEAGQPFMDAVLDVATAHKEKVEQKRLRAALAGERAAHHILWLWDGLDSVHAHHKDVVNALARLYTDGCRMIIASRPTSSPPLPFSNATYEMQAPTPETSADFVAGWCAAFAAARAIPPTERDQWVAECAGWVQTAIESRPTLHAALQHRLALAFLTALACDEPRSDPPAYRKDFYGKHIERLFDTYAAKIGRERDLLPGVTDPQQARHQLFSGLYRLALQQQKAGNGTLRMATYAEVKNALAAAFGQTGGLLGRFQASVRVKAFIDFWEHAGVLASCRLEEQEWLAFRHLAIQQYAAARALVRAHHDSPEALWAELAPYRQNARWRDVVSLALAQVDDADWVIEHVLKDGHATPDVVLFLAGLLNEGVQSTPTTRRYIVDALEQIITTTDCLEQREDAFDALTTIGLIDGETYVTQKLLAMICHEQEDAAIRYRAADVL
ncbi:MAG: NACHT domain-containing protein, partial [Anaerolineae bacterium]|nr:NACHT domain-containing protein [Anaerolineae bacterium]